MNQYELYHHGIKGMKWGVRKKRRNNIKREVQRIVKERENTSIRTLTKDGVKIDIFHEPTPALAKFLAKYSRGVRNNLKNSRNMTISIKGKRVGDLQLYKESKNSINVVWIGIDPKNRGKGYAQAVMNSVAEHARKSGFKKLTLEVPGISPDARHIYEKIGFKMTGEKIGEDDDVWGGLSCMEMDLTNELYHHGVKGMKWGIRKKYKTHPRKKSNKREEEPQQHRKGLTDKQKKYIKIGVGIAATALVAYGSYRLYKSGKLDGLISKGKSFVNKSNKTASNPSIKTGSDSKLMGGMNGFKTKKLKSSITDDLRATNPLFRTGQAAFTNNCGNCSINYEMRRRGFDTEALGNPNKMRVEHVGQFFKGLKDESFNKVDIDSSVKDVGAKFSKSILDKYPEGARGMVGIHHNYGGFDGGHFFNWEVKNGKVLFTDAQNGVRDASDYFKYYNRATNKPIESIRLDDLEPNMDEMKSIIKNVGEKVTTTFDSSRIKGAGFVMHKLRKIRRDYYGIERKRSLSHSKGKRQTQCIQSVNGGRK